MITFLISNAISDVTQTKNQVSPFSSFQSFVFMFAEGTKL